MLVLEVIMESGKSVLIAFRFLGRGERFEVRLGSLKSMLIDGASTIVQRHSDPAELCTAFYG